MSPTVQAVPDAENPILLFTLLLFAVDRGDQAQAAKITGELRDLGYVVKVERVHPPRPRLVHSRGSGRRSRS